MAGEGSIEERGRSPLSSSSPLSNIIKMEAKDRPVGEGKQGGERKNKHRQIVPFYIIANELPEIRAVIVSC